MSPTKGGYMADSIAPRYAMVFTSFLFSLVKNNSKIQGAITLCLARRAPSTELWGGIKSAFRLEAVFYRSSFALRQCGVLRLHPPLIYVCPATLPGRNVSAATIKGI